MNSAQLSIPGTEEITQAERAQRSAEAPLRAKCAQKPCDAGLFGDTMLQTDLVDMAAAKARIANLVDDFFKR